jgi:ribose transport system substrate-binding protein
MVMWRSRSSTAAMAAFGTLALLIAACGDEDGERSAAQGGPEKVRLAVVFPTLDPEFLRREKLGMERVVKEQGSTVEVSFDSGQGFEDVQGQISKVEAAMTQGADGIHVEPAGPDQLQPVLQRVLDEGVKLTTIGPIPRLEGEYTRLSGDQFQGGTLAGQYIADNVKSGEVGIVTCQPGFKVIIDRDGGAKQEIEAAGLEIVATLRGDCDRVKGMQATEDLLTAHPDVKAVFFSNDEMALGGVRAVDEAGISPDEITLVGFDGSWGAAEAILEGKLDATVSQQPEELGALSLETLIKAARGEEVPANAGPAMVLVDEENADQFVQK